MRSAECLAPTLREGTSQIVVLRARRGSGSACVPTGRGYEAQSAATSRAHYFSAATIVFTL